MESRTTADPPPPRWFSRISYVVPPALKSGGTRPPPIDAHEPMSDCQCGLLQVGALQAATERDQRELRYAGVLSPVAGRTRTDEVPDGLEELVRQRNHRCVSASVRHQRQLHGPVRTHTLPATYLQGSDQSRR